MILCCLIVVLHIWNLNTSGVFIVADIPSGGSVMHGTVVPGNIDVSKYPLLCHGYFVKPKCVSIL